jgi:type II restriction/modification system DNA methylase subunit YeeA
LEKNLYGIEIDERAGELAAFALVMKARAKYRRFFRRPQQPNICVLQNIAFSEGELEDYINEVGDDIFSKGLKGTLLQFQDSDTYGSLIQPEVADVSFLLAQLYTTNLDDNVFLSVTHNKVIKALQQAEYLSPRYHVVVANPPYMGGKGMNQKLKKFLQDNYKDVKSDLFSAFVVRNLAMTIPGGQLGFMTPFVWMFISSYEKMRELLINKKTITSLIQLEYSGFEGATVPICTFTLENDSKPDFKGGYVKLSDFRGSENQAPKTLEAIHNPDCGWFFRASASDFKKIPGSPIAYWVSENIISSYETLKPVSYEIKTAIGLFTRDNNRFLRLWYEISTSFIDYDRKSVSDTKNSLATWFPYNKGGSFRKWYGNKDYVLNWSSEGKELKEFAVLKNNGKHWSRSIVNLDVMLKEGITWTFLSSSKFGVRYLSTGSFFDVTGSCVFRKEEAKDIFLYLGFFCSPVAFEFLKTQNPTLAFQACDIGNVPWSIPEDYVEIIKIVGVIVRLAKADWDSYETSWDFEALALINEKCKMNNEECEENTLAEAYHRIRAQWQEMTLEMQRLEEENNRIFIEAYGLQEELTPEVPLNEITLTCNPYYRYKKEADPAGKKNVKCKMENGEERDFPINDDLEARLLADTMREFISYAVGCMFGRYSLDKPGLILANQGETVEDYIRKVKGEMGNGKQDMTFMPDEDNVIPILEGNWFTDDIVERFLQFLRVSFGEEHFEENLQFIEDAIGKDIRKFFLKEFYKDHVKRYKKRPIYWLFSSPKGSFNALIYMHRYRPDTVSVILNDYLREFRTKLIARKEYLQKVSINMSASQKEKTAALKELDKLKKMITELNDYEKEILYPLATKQLEIDLDDGVKVNYNKFGKALKKVTGLTRK